jgi:cytochrome c oxidase subunit 1
MLNDTAGKWHFWLFFIFFNVTFFPMHFTGLFGMPRRIYTYSAELGVTEFNQISTVGAVGLAFSMLIMIGNVYNALRNGELAGPDPWDGATLEWSIPSPPPVYNFAQIPHVHSRDAWWATKHPEQTHEGSEIEPEPVGGGPAHVRNVPHGAATTATLAPVVASTPPVLHFPSPSYWPFVTAMGFLIAWLGLLTTLALTPVGLIILFAGVFGWSFEPA